MIRDASMVPIIFLSARSDEYDRLLSYAFGGDEYMTKPFSPRELLARMNSIFNRQQYYEDKMTNTPRQYSFGAFVIDMDKKLLLKDGVEVSLTAKKYRLLEYLITNRHLTLSKEQILENVWDSDYEGYDNSVMVHIRHLREKIEENPSAPVFLKTVRGRGYIFAG
jgi:DNA-binding response OmpR family regulator